MPPITKPTLVPPTRLEQRLAKLEARVVQLEQASHDDEAALASLAQALEACQQATAPLEHLRQLVRTQPEVAELVMRIVRQNSTGGRILLFGLADTWGLPLDVNDQQYRQALFTQGGLV